MARHRRPLPQLNSPFLTDSGLETDLIFHHKIDLPCFAAFPLLETQSGRDALTGYYLEHVALAVERGVGFVFEAPTWRANPGWGAELGYDPARLQAANEYSIAFMDELRSRAGIESAVISGCLGPRADGYHPRFHMSSDLARNYHRVQIEAFARAEADLVSALTISYADEAIGIVQAAAEVGIPAVVSFTVETDGRLPDTTSLADAIRAVDDATDSFAAYFMINCAHPEHIERALGTPGEWIGRIHGIRANSSRRSHEEMDEATDLDEGDPDELGRDYRQLMSRLPHLTVLGGCCGTDVRHVRAIADACL
jgi:homocysteine S-methyltransferase